MRMLPYKIQMEDGDRYTISNAVAVDTAFGLVPSKENFLAPAIHIKNEPFPKRHVMHGQVINIDDYIKPFFSEDVLPEYKKNYIKAVHSKLKGWKLIAISIAKNHIELTVGKDENHYELLEITAAPYLRFSVEAPTFGGRTAKYLITAEMKDPNGLDSSNNKAYTRIIVTEFEDFGERRIFFENNAPFDVEYTLNEWISVSVLEYR